MHKRTRLCPSLRPAISAEIETPRVPFVFFKHSSKVISISECSARACQANY